ncbi:MAG: hypothetical protein K9M75_01740, partial [Phycisphaerae bacterium]|nr:hypothetical protein [Phycisphaerae bacterium]
RACPGFTSGFTNPGLSTPKECAEPKRFSQVSTTAVTNPGLSLPPLASGAEPQQSKKRPNRTCRVQA